MAGNIKRMIRENGVVLEKIFKEATDEFKASDGRVVPAQPDRYILTLTITTIYAFLMPLSAEVIKPAARGAYTWFYYIFFIAFFEEFLYRGLLPSFLERSYFPRTVISIVPALMYGLYEPHQLNQRL